MCFIEVGNRAVASVLEAEEGQLQKWFCGPGTANWPLVWLLTLQMGKNLVPETGSRGRSLQCGVFADVL